jgi:hypothetical protein
MSNMSWERADVHTCSDGRICRGHKVTTKYTNRKIGKLEAKRLGKSENTIFVTRANFCNRCNQSCSTRIMENQNYRDMTGRGGCVISNKTEVIEPEWRDPKTGKTLKEMKAEGDRELKESKKKFAKKLREQNIELVQKLINNGFTKAEIKTIMMSGIKKE